MPPALRPLPSHAPHCLPTRPTVQRSVQRSVQDTVHNTPCTVHRAQYTVHKTPCTRHRATRAPCARLQAATPSDMADWLDVLQQTRAAALARHGLTEGRSHEAPVLRN